MADRNKIIDDYYNNYDEDRRLVKDQTHMVEFEVTTKYIEKYLKENHKILEVGAGTGRYSLYYANRGYDVTAIEFVQHNLDVLKSKITADMKIVAQQGDAVDLSRFEDNAFDMTLVLGPLYHLYEDADIRSAIAEAVRVTKKGGVVMIAYIPNDGVFSNWGVSHLLDGYPKDFDENFRLRRYPEGVFATFYIEEFKQIMKEFDVEYLHNVATDGLVNIMSEKINNLSKKEFDVWVKYQLSICERADLQGFSGHALYICRKN
ncbi:MAG: class I SAM-dependent methyltransferase [Clostridia bacterium]|nr:class I SAM-dependent methyltransferase [Clostridia bacterium]